MEAVLLKLVDIVLGFFHALAGQHALALLVDLQHVELGFLFRPAKDPLEDVGDINHEIDRVIPANDQVTGFQPGFRFFLSFPSNFRSDFRLSGFDHKPKIKDESAVVEPARKGN